MFSACDELAEALQSGYDTAVTPGSFFEAPAHFRIGFGIQTAALEKGL